MTLKNLATIFFSKAALAVVLPLVWMAGAVPVQAQTAEIRAAGVYYIDASSSTATNLINANYCNWDADTIFADTAKSYKGAIVNAGSHSTDDPWDTSALIEYDQPYPSATEANYYPNHCLGLCFDVYCTNRPMGQSTYSISFPLQTIKFEIAKYYGSKDIVNPDTNPAVRTIMMSIINNNIVTSGSTTTIQGTTMPVNNFMCGSYHCYGANPDFTKTNVCPSPQYYCDGDEGTAACYDWSGTSAGTVSAKCAASNQNTPCVIFDNNGAKYGEALHFCTSWDGSYEILGEFGKTNGQFGFRANIHTDFPGDGNAIEQITVDDTFLYPGDNQYPIQVDVTNVHTVRSTPTVLGAITAVQAAPYTIAYRLSKDADVNITIYDASKDSTVPSQAVRTLVDWQPRLGEGMKGADTDTIVVESDSWDGRDDSGRLLPANNYIVSVQARSNDEWPGTDLSRAVTRQLSLDPLKLTDITVRGLNKQSTAYATINYVPTEASNVYFNVYSPGTVFDSEFTTGSDVTGTGPTVSSNTGVLVYESQQARGRGMSYPDRWDGLCHETDGCAIPYANGTKLPISGTIFNGTSTTCDTSVGPDYGTLRDGNCIITYANGAPLPDGDYIYALWAEIPYTDTYTDAAGNVYTGVKTQRYYTGILPVERGLVDITIQPVSYSTIGSSPTAYGLDPFIFKYSVARESVVNAYVKNTAGVLVKTLTNEGGNTNVAQQMNTLTWDGRDNNGRIVGPGTYLFVVEAADPMFPLSVKTQASAIFPVDLYRVTDVSTTDVYGDSEAKATISYMLSKAMNVQISIYNKDVVIPAQNSTGGTTTTAETDMSNLGLPNAVLPGLDATDAVPTTVTDAAYVDGDAANTSYYVYTDPTLSGSDYTYYRARKNVISVDTTANTETYRVDEVVKITVHAAPWPPRVCDKTTDSALFASHDYVSPADNPQCIYVNDTTFTNYPANPNAAVYKYQEGAKQTLHVRLQPVKTFDRQFTTRAGDGVVQTEEWDAQYFYNPTPLSIAAGGKNGPDAIAACTKADATDKTDCPYEMVPDGTYPFYLSARTEEPMDLYYDKTTGRPLRSTETITNQTGLYATDKPVYRINITRGPVYFLDGSVAVYPNAPQLFNVSSGPIFVPPYEINFAISRAATVEVAVVALQPNVCSTSTVVGSAYSNLPYNNKAGDVCKYLSTMTIPNTANFDPNIVRKLFWDGTDNNGKYVRNGNYEIRLTAKNYPDEGLYQPTVKQYTLNVDLLKVFDLPEAEAYAINSRGTDMGISYQISVPMKVAIQIFKPGTTIFDYTKGTLRDPSTGEEVTDIRDVLVKSIVGIRPSTTLIEELWDGTDYAQQDVPDGTYPFRFVTALNSADIDSITGEIIGNYEETDGQSTDTALWKINKVADTNQYVTLHHATVAIGDGEFVCDDWEKTVFFYPNPFKTATGTLEVTKLPVPGRMSIKYYNLAGDLVRTGGYTCVDAQNMVATLGGTWDVKPDNNISSTTYDGSAGGRRSLRNAALRCFWDRTNDHGKRVARGVYFGLVDFRAQNGRQHCQKVVKILIPK